MSSKEPLEKIMSEIETKTEKKVKNLLQPECPSQKESLGVKNVGEMLVDIMKEGEDEFKAKTGRHMTYSEMRQMYG